MKKKLIGVFVCLLMITTILPITAMAGDENDPEITDNLNDQFGALITHLYRVRTIIARVLLQMDSFDFIDIDSAWFYENESEPDVLYATLKIKDLNTNPQRAIYSIHFTSNGVKYAVGSHLCNNEQNASCFVGVDKRINLNWKDAEATYDFVNNLITFKMNKTDIGDPQTSDPITKTFAWTALRFNFEPLSLLFSDGELVKDVAPFIENNDDYGRDYEILY